MAAEEYRTLMNALIGEIKGLKKAQEAFNKNLDRQLEVHESLLVVHKDIVKVVQTMSQFMSDIPDLMNGLVQMSLEVRDTYQNHIHGLDDIREQMSTIHEFITATGNKE